MKHQNIITPHFQNPFASNNCSFGSFLTHNRRNDNGNWHAVGSAEPSAEQVSFQRI